MTPCRTEKVDFSKKLKKNKNINKNRITKKTNRQEESPEETRKNKKKQKKQKKIKTAENAGFVFFLFLVLVFFVSSGVFSCRFVFLVILFFFAKIFLCSTRGHNPGFVRGISRINRLITRVN
jgi:uncharacterized membrane protein